MKVSRLLKKLMCPHTHTNHSTPAVHTKGNYVKYMLRENLNQGSEQGAQS